MVKKIYLYNENCSLNFRPIKEFLEKTFRLPVIVRKAKDVVVTNGLFLNLSATQKKIPQSTAIIITRRLIATADEIDKRTHLRSCVLSYPSVISLSGIVEAPAKPREYYLAKQSLSRTGLWEIEEARLLQKLKGRFIDYNDRCLPHVIKGLCAQAVFFFLTGEPFCPSKKCRLYNAHWQEDLIYSQIKNGKFCARHSKILQLIKNKKSLLS